MKFTLPHNRFPRKPKTHRSAKRFFPRPAIQRDTVLGISFNRASRRRRNLLHKTSNNLATAVVTLLASSSLLVAAHCSSAAAAANTWKSRTNASRVASPPCQLSRGKISLRTRGVSMVEIKYFNLKKIFFQNNQGVKKQIWNLFQVWQNSRDSNLTSIFQCHFGDNCQLSSSSFCIR